MRAIFNLYLNLLLCLETVTFVSTFKCPEDIIHTHCYFSGYEYRPQL